MAYRLFTTYYDEKNARRRAEIDLCLALNERNFDFGYVLCDGVDWLLGKSLHGFYRAIPSSRPAFVDTLREARAEAGPDDISVIANTDIIIPRDTLFRIGLELKPNQAYCLTRWELDGPHAMQVWDVGYSQDAWVFRGPPKQNIGGDYYFGVPGCDNRFSHELRSAGYDVRNPSKSLPTYHLHLSKKRTPTNTEAHRVPPPYLYLPPTELGQEQPTVEALTLEERRQAFSERRRVRRVAR